MISFVKIEEFISLNNNENCENCSQIFSKRDFNKSCFNSNLIRPYKKNKRKYDIYCIFCSKVKTTNVSCNVSCTLNARKKKSFFFMHALRLFMVYMHEKTGVLIFKRFTV